MTPEDWQAAAVAHLERGEPALARRAARRALAATDPAGPNAAELHLLLAWIQQDSGNSRACLRQLDLAQPHLRGALLARARCLRGLNRCVAGDYRGALGELTAAATKTQDFDGRPLPDGPWHYNKVIWWRPVEYMGPVLIRTSAVGHDGQARIQRDGFADSSFFPSTQPGSRPVPERNAFGYSSGMWVSKPGCYAWQIDGDEFSYVIYLNAILE